MSAKPDGEYPPVDVEEVAEDEESDEYDVEYDDEEIDEEGVDSQEEDAEGEGGGNLTALLLGAGDRQQNDENNEEGSADEGWTPDGGPEPAEDSGEETDEEAVAPAPLKGKEPAVAKREREETGEESEESTQSKRAKA